MANDILKHIGGMANNNLNSILSNDDDPNDVIEIISQSPYFDIESLGKYLQNHSSQFTILSLNIQSLNAKFDGLLSMLSIVSDK